LHVSVWFAAQCTPLRQVAQPATSTLAHVLGLPALVQAQGLAVME